MALTTQQFTSLDDLFAYYNAELFNNELPECLVIVARHRGAHGYFWANRWKERASADGEGVHEIALNPDTMNRPDRDWHSTLVHEMVHHWQQVHGRAPRKCYHDKQFAAKMKDVGLQPSHNGKPGGNETGQSMTHYVADGGPFAKVFDAISAEERAALKLPYIPNAPRLVSVVVAGGDDGEDGEGGEGTEEPKKKSGVKVKYSCSCGNNVWGKGGLKITCEDCEESYQPAD